MNLQLDNNLVQTRQLAITQQVIQMLEILEMGNLEFCAYLQQQVLENPIIDLTDQFEAVTTDDYQPVEQLEWLEANNYTEQNTFINRDPALDFFERFSSDSQPSLTEYLWEQLRLTNLKNTQLTIAKQLLGLLDDNGYLEASNTEITSTIQAPLNQIEKVLAVIQSLEPAGVAAHDLTECLLIQLNHLNYHDPQLHLIITDHLDDLAKNNLSRIAKKTGLSLAIVKEYVTIIKSLNPYPGRAFGGTITENYIRPEIIITKINDRFEPVLNEAVYPTLSMGSYYLKMLRTTDDPQVKQYISGKIKNAVWLMKAVRQRKNTLLDVAKIITDIQQDFFVRGNKYLVPLILSDVAEKLSLHESTISRAIRDKYLECTHGIYNLKYFFSAPVQKGSNQSAQAIKAEIKEIIQEENKKRPYSDSQLVTLLNERQIFISRRTVAKYREELGIEGTFLRKEIG